MKKSLLIIISAAFLSTVAKSQTQPANADFENWQTINGPISNTYQEPNDWNSSNECTALINQFSVTKSTDAYSGTYSARLESRGTSFQGVIANGVITTAQMICLAQGGGQEGGSPYTDVIPDSIVGWYKYAPATNDSAYAQIMFLANNETDTVSFTRVNIHAAANWTRFSAAINPLEGTTAPEKLSLFFSSSWGDGGQGQAVVGSVLYVDAVEFVFPFDIGVGEELSANNWSVYPNPVSGVLNVESLVGEKATIEIFDVTGKVVGFSNLNADRTGIDFSDFVAGAYMYQIRSLDSQILKTGKLLVNP